MPERKAFAVDRPNEEVDEGDMYAIGADDDDEMMNEVDAFLEAHDSKGLSEAENAEAKGTLLLPSTVPLISDPGITHPDRLVDSLTAEMIESNTRASRSIEPVTPCTASDDLHWSYGGECNLHCLRMLLHTCVWLPEVLATIVTVSAAIRITEVASIFLALAIAMINQSAQCLSPSTSPISSPVDCRDVSGVLQSCFFAHGCHCDRLSSEVRFLEEDLYSYAGRV